ncbi:hypothetical protein [Streptomyces sp. NPDC055109]
MTRFETTSTAASTAPDLTKGELLGAVGPMSIRHATITAPAISCVRPFATGGPLTADNPFTGVLFTRG